MNTGTGVKLAIVVGAGIAAYLGLRYAGAKLTGAAGAAWGGVKDLTVKVVDAVNPASTGNLAYRGASAFTRAVTNDPYTTAGAKAWELMNPGAVSAERQALGLDPVYQPTFEGLDNEDAWIGDAMGAETGAAAFDVTRITRRYRR